MPRLLGLVGFAVIAFSSLHCGTRRPLADEREAAIAEDRQRLQQRSSVPPGPLSLPEVLHFALQHNLDVSMMEYERRLQDEAQRIGLLKLLPDLELSGETSYRDSYASSRSLDINTMTESDAPSTSSMKKSRTAALGLTWNILDFGVSWFAARQAGDRQLLADQKLRRARQKVVLEVTSAYWRAVAARESWLMAREVMHKIEERRAVIEKQAEEKTISSSEALTAKRRLVKMLMRLDRFEGTYDNEWAKLTELMGLPPAAPLELKRHGFQSLFAAREYAAVEALQEEALRKRPELFQQDLQRRISVDDVRIAAINMLPSPAGYLNRNWDWNDLLVNHAWVTVGARASWNLLSLPQKYRTMKQSRLKTELVEEKRLAVHIGVLTQVHLSLIEHREALKQCGHMWEYVSIQRNLLRNVKKKVEDKGADVAALLDEEVETVFVSADYMRAYVDVLVAEARIDNTIGRDPRLNARRFEALVAFPENATYEILEPGEGETVIEFVPPQSTDAP